LAFVTQVTSRPGEPFILEVGRPGAEGCFVKSTAVSGNQVVFGQVHLDGIRPFEKRIFQIGDIRCNASGVGGGHAAGDVQLIAYVSVSGALVENDSQTVAMVRQGLNVEVRTVDSTLATAPIVIKVSQMSRSEPTKVAILRFTELFPNAFKSKGIVDRVVRLRDQGAVYTTESYIGPALRIPGAKATESVARGTCLKAVFRCISAGIRLFVPLTSWWASPISAELVDSESTLLSADIIELDSAKIRELKISEDGMTTAVWEIVRPNWAWEPSPGYLDFPIFVCVSQEAGLGTVLVNASFGPTSSVTSSNSSAPVPRFLDTSSARVLFRIED
jgi:hypothetical protein